MPTPPSTSCVSKARQQNDLALVSERPPVFWSRSDRMTVAVGFNPRSAITPTDFVAERRLNRRPVIGNRFDGCHRPRFNRRSATNDWFVVRIRGLNPTATVECRSATKTLPWLRCDLWAHSSQSDRRVFWSRSDRTMVAVGFNPRSAITPTDFVAERRLNRRPVIGNRFDGGHRPRFNRRSATNHLFVVRIRGLKPTATIECRSATKRIRHAFS